MTRSILAAAALLLTLAGCGGGGDGVSSAVTPPSTGCDSSSCGTVLIGLTDADGDFTSYTVDVVSLTLKKANGASVETLPVRQRVDFAELVDLAELVTSATVPNGAYVEGSIRLDYSDADVSVDVGGQPKPARIVDAQGNAVGIVDLAIRLDNRNHVLIAPGRPAFLQLDFDLGASHTVGDLAANPVPATVRPFIVASVERADSRELRVRGPLVSVDTAASSYVVDVRPFHHRDARNGRLTVGTSNSTAWEIDGTTYTGAAGLRALEARPAGTPTAAFGAFDTGSRTFTAQRVHAGTSVTAPQFDALRGNVIAREGDELTVRGVTVIRRDGSVKFLRGDATVLVGPETRVTQDGHRGDDLGAGAISVGQRINAFGDATVADAEERVTLDATGGRVRLHVTHVAGFVKTVSPGALTLDLATIDRHRSSAFDFSGTGTSAATDANPRDYEIATGSLAGGSLDEGALARVFGFVTPFGAAPPDFTGRTLVGFEEVLALLTVGWGPAGTSAPFSSMNPTGLVLDASNPDLGLRHHFHIGPRSIDVTTLATPIRLVPDPQRRDVFAIASGGTVEVFAEFAEFEAALVTQLATAKAIGLASSGKLDAATGDFRTARILVTLTP
jgi:hypothetical protein